MGVLANQMLGLCLRSGGKISLNKAFVYTNKLSQ